MDIKEFSARAHNLVGQATKDLGNNAEDNRTFADIIETLDNLRLVVHLRQMSYVMGFDKILDDYRGIEEKPPEIIKSN